MNAIGKRNMCVPPQSPDNAVELLRKVSASLPPIGTVSEKD